MRIASGAVPKFGNIYEFFSHPDYYNQCYVNSAFDKIPGFLQATASNLAEKEFVAQEASGFGQEPKAVYLGLKPIPALLIGPEADAFLKDLKRDNDWKALAEKLLNRLKQQGLVIIKPPTVKGKGQQLDFETALRNSYANIAKGKHIFSGLINLISKQNLLGGSAD